MIGLGVDVGGTNTDIILTGLADGATLVHKLPSTREDQSRATVQGTLEICEMAGISPQDIELVLHGTTVATNALLEHDGGRTGMLTTEGFRDIIHIGRHQRPHNFSLMQDIPFQRWPLVERKHRKPVPERIIPDGANAQTKITKPDGTVEYWPSKFTGHTLPAGTAIEIVVPNSGGYGGPFERPPELVLSDVLDGFTSAELAERDYGVIIDLHRRAVDEEATRRLREHARPGAAPRAT